MKGMLVLNEIPGRLAPAAPQRGQSRAAGGPNVTNPEPDITEQTAWMLAVRDQRDQASFGLLFDYFAPRLKGMIMRNGTRSAQAEDIVQDVMLTVWHKADQFDPSRAQVSGWVYQIARNRHVDSLRKENRPLPEELAHTEDVPDASSNLALSQEAALLRDALDQLTDDQRDMLERAYFGDLSHSEIRAQTGLPLGTIKSRIRLGLQRLRHELKGTRSQ